MIVPPVAPQKGMTLVEMLVALAATLLLMTAIAQVFAVFGSAISGSRAMLDLDSRMRTVAWRLRTDLGGATARTTPPLSPSSGEGYFEIIEGMNSDSFMYNFYDGKDYVSVSNPPFFTGDAAPGPGGPKRDDRLLGDLDDVLLFTSRNVDTPFVGRAPTVTLNAAAASDLFESTMAEIAWFARPTLGSSNPVTYTLYRKQLLVMGYVGADPFHSSPGSTNRIPLPATTTSGTVIQSIASGKTWSQYLNLPCDVSARVEVVAGVGTIFPNTIGDLTRREARFMHNRDGLTGSGGFPFEFVDHLFPSSDQSVEVLDSKVDGLIFDSTSQRYGEDVVLTNVIAFDVRVFDPAVPVDISASGNTTLLPSDPGYYKDMTQFPVPSLTGAASGAYVDLGYLAADRSTNAINSLLPIVTGTSPTYGRFTGNPHGKSKLGLDKRLTYDTWSTHYEANGVDEDISGLADQGTNGLDDDGNGLIDDSPSEAETMPPYPFPLRGIEVRIRCYEPTSQQVRQVTVRHTFVPH